jgi:hypothetical protein
MMAIPHSYTVATDHLFKQNNDNEMAALLGCNCLSLNINLVPMCNRNVYTCFLVATVSIIITCIPVPKSSAAVYVRSKPSIEPHPTVRKYQRKKYQVLTFQSPEHASFSFHLKYTRYFLYS